MSSPSFFLGRASAGSASEYDLSFHLRVFVDLGADQKAQVLKGLAAKVFSTMSQ